MINAYIQKIDQHILKGFYRIFCVLVAVCAVALIFLLPICWYYHKRNLSADSLIEFCIFTGVVGATHITLFTLVAVIVSPIGTNAYDIHTSLLSVIAILCIVFFIRAANEVLSQMVYLTLKRR